MWPDRVVWRWGVGHEWLERVSAVCVYSVLVRHVRSIFEKYSLIMQRHIVVSALIVYLPGSFIFGRTATRGDSDRGDSDRRDLARKSSDTANENENGGQLRRGF